MTLRDYLLSLRRSWVVIVAVAVLGALGGFAYAQLQPEIYRSEASVIVMPARGDNTSELVQGSSYVQNLVQTYAVVATSPTVLGPVIDELDLGVTPQALANTITVESPLNTVVLNISVVSQDAELAKEVADAVATRLSTAVKDLSPQNADDQPAVRIDTISPAKVGQSPISPNTRLLTAAGALAGLAVGVIYAVLRRLLATRVVSDADVIALTDTPVLGDVYTSPGSSGLPSAIQRDPTGSAAEAVRSIVANLRFASVDTEPRVLLVTSATSGEGKSSISVSLAQIMAEQGSRVLLVDADLRRSSVAQLTQLEGSVGLSTVLIGDVTSDQAVQLWGEDGPNVLTSGVLPPNPGQFLTSDHMRLFVASAREQYDFVIFDSPPVLAVSDPLWLAPLADGIVMIARARVTKRDALKRSIAALETTRVPIFGIVLNAAKRSDSSPYYRAPVKRGLFRRRAPLLER